jgi:hypothetical protein
MKMRGSKKRNYIMKLPAAPMGGISALLRQDAGHSGEGEINNILDFWLVIVLNIF